MISGPGGPTMVKGMRGKRGLACGFVLLLSVGLGSCAGADRCSREESQTEESLNAARAAAAELFAKGPIEKAARLAEEAGEECRRQEDRFPLARSYGQAEELHRQARQAARTARREAELAHGLIRQEAFNRRLNANEGLSRARGAVDRAEKVRGAASLADLRSELAQLEEVREEMQKKLGEGEYLLARRLADRIVEGAVRLEAAANRRQIPAPDR